MTREQRREFLEIIGLVAIVASLIFLGMEVRHANLASRIAARDSVAQGHMEFLGAAIDPTIVAVAWPKAFNNEELTRLEESQLDTFHSRRWRHYERIYHLYLYGVLSEDEWSGYRDAISAARGNTRFWMISREAWGREQGSFSTHFRDVVNAELSQVE